MRVPHSTHQTHLIDQTVIIRQRRNELPLGTDQTVYHPQRARRSPGIEQPRDDDVAGALVGDETRSDEEEAAAVSLVEPSGVAESVDHAAEVERVGTVSAEGEAVDDSKSLVGVFSEGAEIVYPSSPVSSVGDAASTVLLFFFLYCIVF